MRCVLGSNVDFLERMGTHAMFLFVGSIIIGSTPRPLRWLMGCTVGWIIHFLLLRILKIALPLVRQRLEDTAKLKAEVNHPWVPPVGIPFFFIIIIKTQYFLHGNI